jgi:hypothetical protein
MSSTQWELEVDIEFRREPSGITLYITNRHVYSRQYLIQLPGSSWIEFHSGYEGSNTYNNASHYTHAFSASCSC